MVLGKGAQAVNQNGLVFTNENIDKLLMERHIGAMAQGHLWHCSRKTMP
jgi:uncharacterized protein YaiI (UPF0178 family)